MQPTLLSIANVAIIITVVHHHNINIQPQVVYSYKFNSRVGILSSVDYAQIIQNLYSSGFYYVSCQSMCQHSQYIIWLSGITFVISLLSYLAFLILALFCLTLKLKQCFNKCEVVNEPNQQSEWKECGEVISFESAHDYRHFAILYMAVRFLNLSIVSVFSIKLYNSAVSILFTITVVLVAKFQHFKCKWSNNADIVMLLVIIAAYTSFI